MSLSCAFSFREAKHYNRSFRHCQDFLMATAAPIPPQTPPSEPAWTDPLLANPHTVQDKASRVNKMFSAIAPSYDLNNQLHSLWVDQHWRSVAVKMAEVKPPDNIIDVACGTGDLTLKFDKRLKRNDPGNVTGIRSEERRVGKECRS